MENKEHYDYDPFEGRRGKSFFSQSEVEEFERYWHLKSHIEHDDLNANDCVKPKMRLWQIKYLLEGEQKFIGSATIAAPTPKQAEVIFKNESNFNGFVEWLRITEIQEILIPLAPAMLAENYTGVIDKNWLHKYPFEEKKHAHKHYYDLWEKVRELEDYINQLDEKKNGAKIERKEKEPLKDVSPRGFDTVTFVDRKYDEFYR